MLYWEQVVKVSVALFIITDVLGNLPFFIALTDGTSRTERRKIAVTAIVTGLLLLAFFVFAGTMVLDLFSVTMDDLRIAGGILLLIIAVKLLFRNTVEVEHREDVGVVPLGCPLLVGPGAITTVLMMTKMYDFTAVVIGVLICFLVIWLVLHYADFIYRVLGHNGAMVLTKIAAIVIAAIAVRFVRQGIQSIFFLVS